MLFLLGLCLMVAGSAARAQESRGYYPHPQPCLIPEGCGHIEEDPDRCCPPMDIDCSRGYQPVIDRRTCQARCVPYSEDYRKHTTAPAAAEGLSRLGMQMEGIGKSVAGGDMTQAAAGLDQLFSNSEGLKDAVGSDNGSAVVYVPAPTAKLPEGIKPRPEPCGDYVPCDPEPKEPLAAAIPSLARVDWSKAGEIPQPAFHVADCGDSEGCHSEPGKFYEDVTKPIFREIERRVENHDYFKDARDEYGGCRVKGTCSEGDDKATR
ncbi:MAG: hypothetical protein PHU21_05270 [Elusimicrobia bacterium]|nr:hypothetical protein [Elusimicrobiota bacterium]